MAKVFYHEQERRDFGLTGEDMGQTGKEAALLLLGILWRDQWMLQGLGEELREQGKEMGSERTQLSDDARSGISCQERAQEVEQWGIGAAPVCGETASL